jgi:PAS domain S-box-containing protein
MAKILIVEDEAIVAESLHDQLEMLGYSVFGMASSGERALELLEDGLPDLVMMDIMLAGEMDGIATAQEIFHRYRLPVIYLTAYSDPETLKRAKVTEPFGYLVKPYKERELHSALEISLYKHRMEKRLREHERWLDTLLKSIGDGVVTVDLEGKVTSMSPQAVEICGVSEEEARGRVITEVFRLEEGDDEGCLLDLIDEALRGKSVFCLVNEEPVLLRPDGKRVALDAGAAPLQDDHEVLTGVVLTLRDISLRKTAELELSAARNALIGLLTPRETEILQLMVNGSTTKEIAFDLGISPRTVEAHRQNMMVKLQIHDMPMLVRFAITHRMVPLEPM